MDDTASRPGRVATVGEKEERDMTVATTADLEAQDTRRFERYRRVTQRSFLCAALGFIVPGLAGMAAAYGDGRIGVPVAVLCVAGLGLMTWYYMRLVRAGLEGGASRRDIVASGAVTAALSLMLFAHPLFSVVPVCWVSAVVLAPMSRRRIVALCVGTGTVSAVYATFAARHLHPGGHMPWYSLFLFMAALYTATCGLVAFVNRYQRRMWDLHQETHAARAALARLAVTEERLRFSRDLHDLLGHSLSLIAVKSELAMRLAEADPARAGAEMADVRRAARDALREVRAAVHGYRAVELDAELAGVRAVLEAAGVRCDAGDVPDGLPAEVRAVLAWVIREGATNVIKHSEARHCAVALTPYGGSVVLEMRNDGVRGGAATGDGAGGGAGLTGLAERVAVVGGEITARRHGRDGFLLRAVVPLPRPDTDVPFDDEPLPAEPLPAEDARVADAARAGTAAVAEGSGR
ncbi:sensor histidine kinase [Actinomadura opuntiae]|uniref:sensor histidine kinase n=1 Tax=Actinomadura sp. OS1-43 TaxID=604315 RepID=UPI00255A8735|nr:histidine kinase [Actinomadura sp. OS1-43]MDL4820014.1 histidine kinase [Actinomadura sp. OS1-43]